MPSQGALFGGPDRDVPKPSRPDELEVLITVKAAPNPSAKAGETVCVAGLGLSRGRTEARWIRLYPINFRFLEQDQKFKKYDIIRVRAVPATGDSRVESWQPDMSTMVVIDHLDPWKRRRALLDLTASDTMCELNRQNQRAGQLGTGMGSSVRWQPSQLGTRAQLSSRDRRSALAATCGSGRRGHCGVKR